MTEKGDKGKATERHFGVDEAFSVLLKAKRNSDRNYLTELLKVFKNAAFHSLYS
jgi:hypothetical protein